MWSNIYSLINEGVLRTQSNIKIQEVKKGAVGTNGLKQMGILT